MLFSTNRVRTSLYACGLIFSVMIVGCEKDDEEEKSELEGTWSTSCNAEKDGEGAIESHQKTVFVIGKNSYASSSTNYAAADTTCTGTANYVSEQTNNYTVGADVTTPAGGKAFDITPTKVIVTLKNAELVGFFNSGKFCGAEDWVIDTAKDVTTKVCGDGETAAMNAARYDIYDVEGSTLKIGEKDDSATGTTAEKRPTAFSSEVYTKM